MKSLVLIFALSGTAILAIAQCPERFAAAQQPNQRLLKHDQAPGSPAVRRVALVIGNGSYHKAPQLKNPPNDARDMAATLKGFDFEVRSGIDIKQQEMKSLIRSFGQKLKAGGAGLFYYAGHGVQSKGRNYLIPVEADIQSEAEIEDASVDVNLVLNYMEEAQNDLNIVILDACRNNPFARSFRSANDGLAQVDAPTGTLIAYATAPGRVASDGSGQNGLYTAELLKQMRIPGLSVTEMFMRVRAEVMKQTSRKQVPWESSSLVGTFFFNAAAGSGTTGRLPSLSESAKEQAAPRPTAGTFVRKRGSKSGKVLYADGVLREGNHSDKDTDALIGIKGEFSTPLISSLEKTGLSIVLYDQLPERDRRQVLGLFNSVSRGERSQGRSLSAAVYLQVSISVGDMPQYDKLYIAISRISLRLIDLEEGTVIMNEQVGEAKGFGNDQEQARRNSLREASNRIPQTFIDRVKESAW